MRSFEDAIAKSMGDRMMELHITTLTLVLACMIERIGVHEVRKLMMAVGDDLAEFDKGPKDVS